MDLDEYQLKAAETDRNDREDLAGRMARILGLASESGAVLELYKRLLRDNMREADLKPMLKQELGDVLWFCATIAAASGLQLSDVAGANLARAQNRYGNLNLEEAPEFEDGLPIHQRFPRRLVVQFAQKTGDSGRKRSHPVLVAAEPNAFPDGSRPGAAGGKRIGYDVGKSLGDPLTDNQRLEDGYRFHDAIHMGFMAVLGWSPVMRYMLRIKRKSDEATEEGEDSVRQALAEEGLAAVLAQMAKRRLGFLHARSINDEVMDVVRTVTNDTEVRACSDSLWAKAISEGFRALKALADNGGGFLVADLDQRTLTFSKEMSEV